MQKLKKWFTDILTEPNTNVICPIRIFALFGFVYMIGTHAFTIFGLHATFDLTAFCTSYGIMIATTGAALGFKTDSKADVKVVAS